MPTPAPSLATLIWTRPHHEHHHDLSLLSQCPYTVIPLAVTIIQPHDQELQRFLTDLHHHYQPDELIVVTSPVTARLLIKHIPHHIAATITVACFGHRTTTLLNNHGFKQLQFTSSPAHSSAIQSSQQLFERLRTEPQLNPSTPPLSPPFIRPTLWYPRAQHTAYSPPPSQLQSIREYILYHHTRRHDHQLDHQAIHQLNQLSPAVTVVSAFSSPLIYHSYRHLKLPLGHHQVVIGATTAQALKHDGLHPVIATTPTPRALIAAATTIITSASHGSTHTKLRPGPTDT